MSTTRNIKDVRDQFNRGTKEGLFDKGINAIIETVEEPYSSDLLKVRNKMNSGINAVIREMENPVSQIDEDFQLKNFKKIIATTFIPDLLINKEEFTYDDFTAYIDKAVRLNAFNVVRAHIYAVWSAEVNQLIYMPHPRIDGKYDLTKYVKKYQDTIVKRLKYIKETGIVPWIDIINGGSNARWARYFLNPDLNSFDTHPWNQSIWHAYEYVNEPPPEGPQYKQTLKWFNAFFDEMVSLVEREVPGCMWSAHETKAGTNWHRKVYYAALKRNGVDSARITTNLDMTENEYPYAFADFNQKLHREGIIPDIMMLRVDGLYNKERYDYYRSELADDNNNNFKIIPDLKGTDKPLPVIMSGDGSAFPNPDVGYNLNGVYELIDIMKRDNHLGIEVNLGTWPDKHISEVDLGTASRIAERARN